MTIWGFTGSRNGPTTAQNAVLDTWANLGEFGGENHHGDCIGADEDFHHFALRYGGTVVIHPPTDDKYRAFCDEEYDGEPQVRWEVEKPYLDRNRDIVDACDQLLACPKVLRDPGKGGTWYTIHYARQVGKPVTIIWPDGTVTHS